MANVAHSTLTGSELHEPKGADTAGLGTVYVSNGAGSGSWSSIGTSAFTGMIADFASPVAPTGWLELDGSVISTATYSGLFAVMSITSSGTRTSGNPVITSIPSTTNFRAGYFVFGTGISAGTTILSVDSGTQITMSGNAGSSGTSSFFVSPWAMNTGTVTLPNVTTAGRYRRSRTASTKVGDLQADQNKAHTHTGTTGNNNVGHTHTYSGSTGAMSANASHTHTVAGNVGSGSNSLQGGGTFPNSPTSSTSTSAASTNTDHTHTYSGTTSDISQNHTHSFTTSSDGGSELRPISLVVMTCIKT